MPLPPWRRSSCRMRPGCSSDAGSSSRALEIGQAGEHPAGEGSVEGQRHPGRQQRVATEQRHEPRSPGGHDGAVGVRPVDDAQGRQIGERLVDGGRQPRVERHHRGDRRAPGGQLADRHPTGQLGGALEVGRNAGRDGLHRDRDRRLLPRGDAQPPARGAASRVGLVRRRLQGHLGAVVLVVRGAQGPLARSAFLGPGRGRIGGAALDVEDVREVGRHLELEVHAHG